MNARLGEFSDSVSFFAKPHTRFRDANSDTAAPESEYEWLRQESGIFPRCPYESNSGTADFIIVRNDGTYFVFGDIAQPDVYSISPGRESASVPGLDARQRSLLTPVKDWALGLFCFNSPASEASTLPLEPHREELDWSSCLAGFIDEEIEDGMTATLGEKISNLVRIYGSEAIKGLKELITSHKLPPSLASHTLRWLGRIKDPASSDTRLNLLCESLRSKSPVVRDGASLGLVTLGSPKAIPYLQKAIAQEKLPGLRDDMEQVLRELQI